METRIREQNEIRIIDSKNPDWEELVLINRNGDIEEARKEKDIVINHCNKLLKEKGFIFASDFQCNYNKYVLFSNKAPNHKNIISSVDEFLQLLYK